MTPVEPILGQISFSNEKPVIYKKPKVVQIVIRDSFLYVLFDDGQVFEADTATGSWKKIPLPQ